MLEGRCIKVWFAGCYRILTPCAQDAVIAVVQKTS